MGFSTRQNRRLAQLDHGQLEFSHFFPADADLSDAASLMFAPDRMIAEGRGRAPFPLRRPAGWCRSPPNCWRICCSAVMATSSVKLAPASRRAARNLMRMMSFSDRSSLPSFANPLARPAFAAPGAAVMAPVFSGWALVPPLSVFGEARFQPIPVGLGGAVQPQSGWWWRRRHRRRCPAVRCGRRASSRSGFCWVVAF